MLPRSVFSFLVKFAGAFGAILCLALMLDIAYGIIWIFKDDEDSGILTALYYAAVGIMAFFVGRAAYRCLILPFPTSLSGMPFLLAYVSFSIFPLPSEVGQEHLAIGDFLALLIPVALAVAVYFLAKFLLPLVAKQVPAPEPAPPAPAPGVEA